MFSVVPADNTEELSPTNVKHKRKVVKSRPTLMGSELSSSRSVAAADQQTGWYWRTTDDDAADQ